MSRFLTLMFLLFSASYASSILFVLIESDEQVESYCFHKIVESEHELSQRRVACSFRGDR